MHGSATTNKQAVTAHASLARSSSSGLQTRDAPADTTPTRCPHITVHHHHRLIPPRTTANGAGRHTQHMVVCTQMGGSKSRVCTAVMSQANAPCSTRLPRICYSTSVSILLKHRTLYTLSMLARRLAHACGAGAKNCWYRAPNACGASTPMRHLASSFKHAAAKRASRTAARARDALRQRQAAAFCSRAACQCGAIVKSRGSAQHANGHDRGA